MDASIPEELRMLQGTVRRFVENEVMPLEVDYKEELPPEVRDPLQESDTCGWPISPTSPWPGDPCI